MKRKQNKNTRYNILQLNKIHAVLIFFLILLSTYTAFISFTAYSYWKLRNNDFSQSRSLIIEAVESLYKPTIIGPLENKQYAHEAKIRFDIPNNNDTFRYYYMLSDDDTNEPRSIHLTTNNTLKMGISNLGADAKLFERIPDFQRCSKEFIVVFGEKDYSDAMFDQVYSKELKNGDVIHLHRNSSCDEFYQNNNIDLDEHELILKSIESY